MKISRSGTDRNRGEYETSLEPTYVFWNSYSQTVSISAYRVRDFDTPARHNWTISISPAELAKVIEAIGGKKGAKTSRATVRELAPSLTAMLKLAAKCSGEASKKPKSRVA